MDNNIEKKLDEELEVGKEENDTLECDETDEVFEDGEVIEADEEALEELKKLEASVDKSFKNMITVGSILLGAAVLLGIVLAIVL